MASRRGRIGTWTMFPQHILIVITNTSKFNTNYLSIIFYSCLNIVSDISKLMKSNRVLFIHTYTHNIYTCRYFRLPTLSPLSTMSAIAPKDTAREPWPVVMELVNGRYSPSFTPSLVARQRTQFFIKPLSISLNCTVIFLTAFIEMKSRGKCFCKWKNHARTIIKSSAIFPFAFYLGEKLLPSDKYTMSEYALSEYSRQMNLTVKSLEKQDFGGYVCSSVNALGKAEGSVRLQELQLFAKTTPTTFVKNMDKPRKKAPLKGKKKGNSSNDRRGHAVSFGEADSVGSDDDFGTTQIMAGSTLQEGQRTDRPLVVPSLPPPWVNNLAANFRHSSVSAILLLLLLPTTL
ncbi:hypothetical protein ACFW04_010501 [Cataglyphis niger]